ncbi:hypothetical protein GCM10025868_31710 [Angustibacter aerolatus]|uniref:EAL domain-containing protein n=1 Tax=Angustibacter aerolatus TaxID=1162965 RepID=A0ABQ6JMH6_9ACTN|nr:hypothetical protein GCM10025868_31710 [Angustibacter aerolatus]
MVPDARHHPVSAPLPITERMGIGSYVGVPLHGPGGTVTGMLCALGRTADPRLDEQAPRFLAMLAAILSERMSAPDAVRRRRARERAESVEDVLDAGGPAIVHQPLVRLPDRAVRGFEALARFDSPAFVSPAHAFAVAAQTGHGVEPGGVGRARRDGHAAAAGQGQTLTVNLSAEALADGRVVDLVLQRGAQAAASGRLLAVEVTEHTVVDDYPALRAVRERLRAAGLAVYVDDAGAGYASLHHVLEPAPRRHQGRHRPGAARRHRPRAGRADPVAGGVRAGDPGRGAGRGRRDGGRARGAGRPRGHLRAGLLLRPPRPAAGRALAGRVAPGERPARSGAIHLNGARSPASRSVLAGARWAHAVIVTVGCGRVTVGDWRGPVPSGAGGAAR